MKLFGPESPLVKALAFIGNMFLLNVLFIVCSLPVVTFGASASALYSVAFKITGGESTYIAKDFFRAFRKNFLRATGEWLIILLVAFGLWYGTEIMENIPHDFPFVITVAYIIIALLLVIEFSWVFAIEAKFENSLGNQLKNAVILAVTNPLRAVVAAVLSVFPVELLMFAPYYALLTSVFWFLFGFAGIALINSLMFRKVFDKYR